MQYDVPSYSGFRCVACNIAFNNFDDQKKHYFAYHSRNMNTVPAVFSTLKPQLKPQSKVHAKKAPVIEMKCDICNLSCSSQATYDLHINGKKHAKSLNKLTQDVSDNNHVSVASYNGNQVKTDLLSACDGCGVSSMSDAQMAIHYNGLKHQKMLKMKMYNELKERKDPSVYCINCDLFLMQDLMKLHMEGGKHKRKCKDNSSNEPEKKKPKINVIPTTIEMCGYCLMEFKKPEDAITHFQSKLHMSNMASRRKVTDYHCKSCEVYLVSQELLDTHLNGFKHYVRINRGNPQPEGKFSEKLLKMREKMRSMKFKRSLKNVKSEIDVIDPSVDSTMVTVETSGDNGAI